MALSQYNKKRNFKKTEEPEGKNSKSRGALKFVVQKHDASHLHYDFRLEMDGVLKSWAVPKGPSLNPQDKRLAMAVEDHPYDYKNFEGIIPEGEYGGGTVIVWDEGTYTPMNAEGLSRREQEKLLLEQWHKGDLKLHLNGHKLKGDFALFRMKGRGENSWLLVKKADDFASRQNILLQDASVKSGKTIAEVADENGVEVKHPDADVKLLKKKAAPKKIKTAVKKDPSTNHIAEGLEKRLKAGKKAPMPQQVVPMMAVLVDEAFDDPNWIFEIKWDGYRALAYCKGGNVILQSRNLKYFTNTYPPITGALKEMKLHAVLDGEIVALNEKGIPDFQKMQNWKNTPVPLVFYVFDILWCHGYDLTALPLLERKDILKNILPENDRVRYSDHVERKGKDFFELSKKKGLEGIMAKKADGPYRMDKRSEDWLKIKVTHRQEVVIGGYTEPRNTREYFGALLLGVYRNGKLEYVGHTGSGFNAETLKKVYGELKKLKTSVSPFVPVPKTNQSATWVKPELVCEIKFSEWTKDGKARHPIFQGLRTDKSAKDVVMEVEKDTDTVRKKASSVNTDSKKKIVKEPASKKAPSKNTKIAAIKTRNNLDDSFINKGIKEQIITLNTHELKLTNLDKLYWKEEKFSKGEMLDYYWRIAPWMLPHLKDRPHSLNRHPNGISGKNFYQKDVKGKVADWVETFADESESTGKTVHYFVCHDEAHLIYMANLGCIEINPWHSRTAAPEKPDWCLIDLDPDNPNTFAQVMDVALLVKQLLDSIHVTAYPKTSGSTGIHIYIPLAAKYSYEQSRQLAELIVNLVHHEMPEITSIERNPAKRKGKIYLDYLQNRFGQTAAAPYSLRPKPGVPVSTPLDWSELKKGLLPTTYNAYNIFDRLKTEGDLFQSVLGKGIDLKNVLKRLQGLFDAAE